VLNKKEVKKVKAFYRGLSFFICLILLMCIAGLLVFGFKENLFSTLGILAPLLFMLYVLVPIVVWGYPPKFLLWVLDAK